VLDQVAHLADDIGRPFGRRVLTVDERSNMPQARPHMSTGGPDDVRELVGFEQCLQRPA
jgi:hypothetical protein